MVLRAAAEALPARWTRRLRPHRAVEFGSLKLNVTRLLLPPASRSPRS